jgi:hypothetical protein
MPAGQNGKYFSDEIAVCQTFFCYGPDQGVKNCGLFWKNYLNCQF